MLRTASAVAALMALAAARSGAARPVASAAARPGAAAAAVWGLEDDDACAAGGGGASASCAAALLQHGSSRAAAPRVRAAAVRGRGAAAAAAAVPATMQATMVSPTGGLIVGTEAVPASVAAGFMLVRMGGSSVNPIDFHRESFVGRWPTLAPLPSGDRPLRVSVDFAGEVAQVGPGCPFAVGDEVWGVGQGTWCDYMVVSCDHAGRKPASISFIEAGALSSCGLTSMEVLRSAGAPWTSSPTVLILGGSGGVGHLSIQLAKEAGAGRLITTTSGRNAAFVRSLGADEVIDYTTTDWTTALAPNSVDVVLDTVGDSATMGRALDCIRPGGQYITIVMDYRRAFPRPLLPTTPKAGVEARFFLVTVETSHLDTLRGLVDAGRLAVTIDSTYPLANISGAIAHAEEGHDVGKVAISFPQSA